MGTNFYARIIPKEEDKQKLIDAINNNLYDKIIEMTSELYDERNEYSGKGAVIHLGKRSGGWKFLWNPNVVKYPDGYLDKEGNYILEYKYDYVYSLTKEGITSFVMRDDVVIMDEYDEVQDKQEFLDMAFSWGQPDGLTAKEYQENPKYDAGEFRNYHYSEKHQRWMHSERDEMWFDLGYIVEYYDFESDGLRFSTSVSFS